MTDPYGVCPSCHRCDGVLNIGRQHFGACHAHKVFWPIGSNLFSSWLDEPAELHAANAARLATYRQVAPHDAIEHEPRTVCRTRAADSAESGRFRWPTC